MTNDPWDWSFASFAEQPPVDDNLGSGNESSEEEEPTRARPFPGGLPVSDGLERHLWRLRMASTPDERRRAAAAALRYLEETRRAAASARRRAVEDDPTLVDKSVPVHFAGVPLFEGSSSGDASLP